MSANQIVVNINEAALDSGDLRNCWHSLRRAQNELDNIRLDISAFWQGQSAVVCAEQMGSISRRIDTLIQTSEHASRLLDNIWEIFQEADRAGRTTL